MKFKRTAGKWKWKLTVLDSGDQRVIFADEKGNELHPTIGDVELMEHAPEMYEMLCRFVDFINEKDMCGLMESAKELIAHINVESQKEDRQ